MLPKLRLKWLFLFVFFSWIFGCGEGSLSSEYNLVEANGKPFISLKEFLDAFNDQYQQWATSSENPSVDQGKVLELKKAYLDRFIEEKLILEKAKELGIEVTNEELKTKIDSLRRDYPGSQIEEMSKKGLIDMERLKEGIRKDLLMRKVVDRFLTKKVAVSQEEARDYFETRRELYHVPKQVRASQIVVATDMKARRILGLLRDGGDFAKLARDNSLSPDRKNGGDLGFFSPGQMPKEFDEVVFSLPVGQWSHVTGSPYGYHVFVVHEKKEARRLTFQEVKERIITEIRQKKEGKLYQKWIIGMKKEAEIKVKTELLLSRHNQQS
jgi:peptidyl-prolyl cis-trans isomerase C